MQYPRLAFQWLLVSVCAVALSSAATAVETDFVRVEGSQFIYKGQVVKIKGCNYYPQDHMWGQMWQGWNSREIAAEADRIRDLGMNAVRLMVPYSHANWGGANPRPERLMQLEELIRIFGERGIRSCVALFDWETSYPDQNTLREAQHLQYLTAIVSRFRDSKYVLMWDVKNEPDHPSHLQGHDNWGFDTHDRDRIVSWLARMCAATRRLDTNHPVSIGLRWWQNTGDVLDLVDVVIFHSYFGRIGTRQIPEVKRFLGSTRKPILVEEFGWPSGPCPSYKPKEKTPVNYDFNEAKQLLVYRTHLTAFKAHDIAGGFAWMAFDKTPYAGKMKQTHEDFFGLWRYGYDLKPAGEYYRDHFKVRLFDP